MFLDKSSGNRIRFCLFTVVHGVSQRASQAVSLFAVYHIFRRVSSALLHFFVWLLRLIEQNVDVLVAVVEFMQFVAIG